MKQCSTPTTNRSWWLHRGRTLDESPPPTPFLLRSSRLSIINRSTTRQSKAKGEAKLSGQSYFFLCVCFVVLVSFRLAPGIQTRRQQQQQQQLLLQFFFFLLVSFDWLLLLCLCVYWIVYNIPPCTFLMWLGCCIARERFITIKSLISHGTYLATDLSPSKRDDAVV